MFYGLGIAIEFNRLTTCIFCIKLVKCNFPVLFFNLNMCMCICMNVLPKKYEYALKKVALTNFIIDWRISSRFKIILICKKVSDDGTYRIFCCIFISHVWFRVVFCHYYFVLNGLKVSEKKRGREVLTFLIIYSTFSDTHIRMNFWFVMNFLCWHYFSFFYNFAMNLLWPVCACAFMRNNIETEVKFALHICIAYNSQKKI